MTDVGFNAETASTGAGRLHGERSTTVAVILAAGQGTRMRSALPKVLHEVLGRPLVHFPVLAALEAGVSRVVVVVGHGRDQVEASVRSVAPDAIFAVQSEQRGTADAVKAAVAHFGDARRVLILSGDVPGPTSATIAALLAAPGPGTSASPLTVVGFTAADPTGYGRLVTNADGGLLAIVEHKDAAKAGRTDILAETRCNAGIYLVERDLLSETLTRVAGDNAQGELYLTDVARFAAEAGRPGRVYLAGDAAEVEGVNDRAQLAQADARLRRRRNLELMRAGVTLLDPERIRVGFDVTVEADVVLGPDVTLTGRSTVASGASIGQGTVVKDSRIAGGAEILPYCVLDDADVGPRATVGPFAHLRPGTRLLEKAKVGNFVETKKTTLGRGAKASHLTYLGDCDVGEDSNIGAGTITCNYDGVNKHRTRIGARVFVGSNTELVAPCTLGDESVVGAGTTVTADVPAGALALSRAPQVNLDGWAARRGPFARKRARTASGQGEH
ncbi:MAG: bifunctional UDP-N-acetylglucosamine diphosphorylase/glucosamine-1-phosphate N-acetyltransferase GlmU [Myxococcales bacterium]|nr:bifunctional UDP-N-acetylglucosamine diphosphorylase/glucosamine-1-phosphate N-acetyltransferase GlmU [Myxococcales bacterium]